MPFNNFSSNRFELMQGKTGMTEIAKKSNNLLVGAIIGAGTLAAIIAAVRKKREYDFSGKVAVITGGSRGLGLVLARQLAAENAKIAICARDADELGRAQSDLESQGAEVFSAVCDVRDKLAVETFIGDVADHFGRIDVLINNAGVIQVAPLENQTEQDFTDAMQVHFWGPFYMMQAAIPKLKESGGGRIVNIASIGGKVAVPHLAPYSASKFALVGLSSAMRNELVKENIFVTTVCPGLMRTGSHLNAIFKGQNEREFAWFSVGNALPVTSISAETAAQQIISAAKGGKAEAIISVQAEIIAKINQLFPEFTSEAAAFVNQLLPSPGGIGEAQKRGFDSASFVSPSFLTTLADKASVHNNELKPGEHLT